MSERLCLTHKTAKYLVPSPDADADEEAVAAGADAAELEAEAATAWTGRSLETAAEVGVASEPESLGTHAAEAEDKARARAAICLVENIFEAFFGQWVKNGWNGNRFRE